MKLSYLPVALFALTFSGTTAAQQMMIQPDSVFTPTLQQLDSLRQLHPLVYSNKGCGRCATAKEFLTEHKIPFVVLNIGLPENRATMYSFAQKASEGALKGIHYPVIVYKDLTQFGQNDIQVFLAHLAETIQAEKNPAEK